MSDSFSETTNDSWFSRIGNALKGILVGVVLIPLSIGGLVWNEGRAVKTARSLKEGARIVQSVDSAKPDPVNEGKLVHVTGLIATTDPLEDDELGVPANGIRLVRTVEMFQWTETSKSTTRKKLGGGKETTTTYTYKREWKEGATDSSSFRNESGHENPTLIKNSTTFVVGRGTLGGFTLTGDQLNKFGVEEPLPLTSEQANRFPGTFGTEKKVTIDGGKAVLSNSAASPEVGDIRVSYGVAKPGPASLVAAQRDSGFGPYTTSNEQQIFLTSNGTVEAAQMFKAAVAANKATTWALRAAGLALLFVGFRMIMSIVGVLGDVVPFFGSVLNFGVGIAAGVMTVVFGVTSIALAWIAYRPIVGIGLLLGAALLAGAILFARNKARPREVLPSPQPS
jgi:Transmembrane protein 43